MNKKYKNRLFWILQITGWTLYALSMYFLFWKYKKGEGDLRAMFLFFLTYIVGFIMTAFVLRYLYRYLRHKIKNIYWLLAIIFTVVLMIVPLWYFIDINISSIWWEENAKEIFYKKLTFLSFLRRNYYYYVISYGWTALYLGIKYFLEWQEEKKRSEDAFILAQKAQFQMLRNQVNPHFLFNSLNSIKALVDEDRKSAKQMITELSDFLRYSLINKDVAFRPLKEELDALKLYLAIEKKRFEEKLQINYEISTEAESKSVLSFLIHPIIENAIKYGMETSVLPLQLQIKSYVDESYLIIEICNSGKWIERDEKEHSMGTGTGLTNVKKRLANAYPENHIFEIDKEGKKVCVKIGMKTNESNKL